MPKTKEAYELIRKEKREYILNCAIGVFAKKGYSATNIDDIAQSAGISVGLIYRYFSSKEALYSEIVDIAISGLDEISALVETSQFPKETIEGIAEMILQELNNEEFINLNLMMVQSTTMSDSPRYDEILESDKAMFASTAKLIKRGQEQGVFSEGDPMRKSVYFFSSIMGLVMTSAIYKGNYKTPTKEDITAFLF